MSNKRVWVKLYEDNSTVTDEYLKTIGGAYTDLGFDVFYVYRLDEIVATREDIIVLAVAPDVCHFLLRGFKHIVYWSQGVWPEENYLRHHSRLRFSVCSAIEKAALRGAERLFFVSSAMLRHYESKYSISLCDKVMIMPCSNETFHRESFRVEGKYERPVFTYAGSLVEYQCIDQTLEAFASVKERLPQAELLIFTGEVEAAKKKVARLGIPGVSVDCKPPQDLWQYISRAKYGFVLREDCAVNRVATPTKISTYLANGVIPVYSKCVEAFSETSGSIPCLVFDSATFVDDVVEFERKRIDPEEIASLYEGYFSNHLDLASRRGEIKSFLVC